MQLNWSSSFDVTTYTEVPCHSMYWVWKIHPCMLKAVSTEPGFCSPLPAIVTKNIYNQSTKWDQRQIWDWSSRRLPPCLKKMGICLLKFLTASCLQSLKYLYFSLLSLPRDYRVYNMWRGNKTIPRPKSSTAPGQLPRFAVPGIPPEAQDHKIQGPMSQWVLHNKYPSCPRII